MKIINIELDGFAPNRHDYDYWCDVYVSYAEHTNGVPLTEWELDKIDSDVIYEEIHRQLF